MKQKPPKLCHCGYAIGHPQIHEEPEYSTFGWLCLAVLGMTPRPSHIVFRCVLCRAELGVSRDPRRLERGAS